MVSLFPVLSYADSGITIDPSFTYEDGYWKPGRVETKDFYINNNKENDISIDRLYINLKSSEYWKTGEKLDINSKQFKEFARYSTATLKHNNTVLFQDTLENLLSRKGINLSKDIDIKANDKELLNMTIDMDIEMNNDAQALNNVFTIGVAYKMEEPPLIPSNPTEPPTKPDLPINPEVPTNPELPINPDIPINPDVPTKPINPSTGGVSDKLPQTGGVINSTSLTILGAVAIGAGFMMNRKSDENRGGKHNE